MLELRRLHPRIRAAEARRRYMGRVGGFFPTQVSAISAWLRVANATVTGSGISSLPDVLNSNPAVQSTDAERPPLGTSGNGLSLLTFNSGTDLELPLIAANNATSQWGMACHISTANNTVARTLYGIRTGHGSDRLRCNVRVNADESFACVVYIDETNNRVGTTVASVIGNSTVHFVTVEFDGTAGTEATQLVLTVDGVPLSLTFSNDAGTGSLPSSMTAAVGSGLLGAFNNAGTSAPFLGFAGPNIYFMNSKMSGATEGLLTSAARTALSNFDRPT